MKTLSVVIPVFNEEKRLIKTFRALDELKLPRGLRLFDIIFVNDGSTDKTLRLVKEYKKTRPLLPIHLISYTKNRGKGFAVKKGMLSSKGDFALLCDADMSTPFSELKKMIPNMHEEYDIVIGTRKNGKSTVIIHQPKVRELLGKGFTYFTQMTLMLPVTDFTCGFKLFSRPTIDSIFGKTIVNRWGYDAEILFLAKNNGFPVIECPVLWSDDRGSHVNVFSAIPTTLLEIAKILLFHKVTPYIKLWVSFPHATMQKITASYK